MRVNNIKDQFGDLAEDRKLHVDVGEDDQERTLELDMTVDDLAPLMTMGGPEGGVTEEDAQRLTSVLKTVMYRSYLPHWDDAEDQEPRDMTPEEREENEEVKGYLDRILLQYMGEIFVGISVELGWQDEDQAHQTLQKQGNLEINQDT